VSFTNKENFGKRSYRDRFKTLVKMSRSYFFPLW